MLGENLFQRIGTVVERLTTLFGRRGIPEHVLLDFLAAEAWKEPGKENERFYTMQEIIDAWHLNGLTKEEIFEYFLHLSSVDDTFEMPRENTDTSVHIKDN